MKKVTHVEKKSGDISIQRDTTMGDHTKHLPSSFSRYTVFFFRSYELGQEFIVLPEQMKTVPPRWIRCDGLDGLGAEGFCTHFL